jgi:hypothetical protein
MITAEDFGKTIHISRTSTLAAWLLGLRVRMKSELANIKQIKLRGPFEKCGAIMQREAVNFMHSCSGGGNVVVA